MVHPALKTPSGIAKRLASWWARRTLALRFATLTAVLIAATALIEGTALVGFASRIVNTLERERVQQRLGEAATQLQTHVEELQSIPRILAGTPPVPRITDLSTGGTPKLGESLDVWIRRLSIIFRSFVQANPDIMQARFIGAADGGREIVRVDREGDDVRIVAVANLQRKGDRPYFQETAKLRPGEVYLSPVEANQENGVVVKPFQPTIRAATPIFTETGKLFGVIVVNMAVDYWLQHISALSKVSGKFMVADQRGDYIYRSDNGPTFNSHQGASESFKKTWPQLADVFNRGGPAFMNIREGEVFISAQRVAYDPEDASQYLVFAADVNADSVFGETWRMTTLGAAIALVLSMIGVLAAYLVSRPLKGLMNAAKQIAEGRLDVSALAKEKNVEVGELGEALRIMKEAVDSRDVSLRKSEAALKAILDNTIDGLITLDRSGTIVGYNRGCEDIFGYKAAQALGQNVDVIIPKTFSFEGADPTLGNDGIQSTIVGERHEVTGRRNDGQPIELEVAMSEIQVGEDVLVSGIVRDITKQKQIDRMKSEFISTVTHELRTPLTSIMGTLELASAGALGELPDELRHMIDLAHNNGERLVNIINDILDMDKLAAGKLVFCKKSEDLKLLLEQAVEQNAAYALKHEVSIKMDGVPTGIIVDTDADRFQQVMSNLISNAAKYSPAGDSIRISAEMSDGRVQVSVADKGPGIAPAFRDRVFERFAQMDSSDTRQKGGTGLGLCITKSIVEQLGGAIGFETKMGSGTKFYFDLPARLGLQDSGAQPVSIGPADGQIVQETQQDADASGLPRILHVEDDRDTVRVLAAVIARAARITAVGTAREARALLERRDFDLVILDIHLPGENGDSVLRYLSNRDAPAPRVLVYSVEDFSAAHLPLVSRALVKSRTDVASLRDHILELLRCEPPEWTDKDGHLGAVRA
jgi:PAS domain S-box-containing protein